MSSPSKDESETTLRALAAGFGSHRARQAGGDGGIKAQQAAVAAGEGEAAKEPESTDVHPGVRSASSSQHEAEEAFKSAIGIPENAEHEEDAPYPGSGAEEDLLPPPDFRPFFTLIEDSALGDYHHPTVHYIFSDDDPDDLTNAMLAAIEQQARSSTDAQAETEERMLLLEVTPDGKAITSAASLHPRWQALKVNVAQAPSWGGASAEGGDGRLMLTISGHEAESESRAEGLTAVEDLVKTFNERLESLDEIVGKHGETTAMPDDTTADRDE